MKKKTLSPYAFLTHWRWHSDWWGVSWEIQKSMMLYYLWITWMTLVVCLLHDRCWRRELLKSYICKQNNNNKFLQILKPPILDFKPPPEDLKYAFLVPKETFSMIISTYFEEKLEKRLLSKLRMHKGALRWNMADIKSMDPLIYTTYWFGRWCQVH